MSGQEDPGSWVGRLFGWCLLMLLAAMALYGAVQIVASVWVQLALGLAVVLVVLIVGWMLFVRPRRW